MLLTTPPPGRLHSISYTVVCSVELNQCSEVFLGNSYQRMIGISEYLSG